MEDSGCWIVGLPPDLIPQHDSMVIITQQVGMLSLQWFFLLSSGIGQQVRQRESQRTRSIYSDLTLVFAVSNNLCENINKYKNFLDIHREITEF